MDDQRRAAVGEERVSHPCPYLRAGRSPLRLQFRLFFTVKLFMSPA